MWFNFGLYFNAGFIFPFQLPWFTCGWPVPPGDKFPSFLASPHFIMNQPNNFITLESLETSRWMWLGAKCGHFSRRFFGFLHPRPVLSRPRYCSDAVWKWRGKHPYKPLMHKWFSDASLAEDLLVWWWWNIEGPVESLCLRVCVAPLHFVREPDFSVDFPHRTDPTHLLMANDWSGHFALSRVTGRSGTCTYSGVIIGLIEVHAVDFYLRGRWMMRPIRSAWSNDHAFF